MKRCLLPTIMANGQGKSGGSAVAFLGLILLGGVLSLRAELPATLHVRGTLAAAEKQLEQGRAGRVAFLGGSITEMEGYRPRVIQYLRRRFPETDLSFANAGIASTGSTTGAFRLESEVLRHGQLDLLFVDFAVNDDQDEALSPQACLRAMEGIVRHVRREQPHCEIVLIYFVNPGMLKSLRQGKVPLPIQCHEQVARHYGMSSVNVAAEVAKRINKGEWTWQRYGGTHPGEAGNKLCAELVQELLERAWKRRASSKTKPRALPDPIDPLHYGYGKHISPENARTGPGWRFGVPDWTELEGQLRGRFERIPLLTASDLGASLTLSFEGTAMGAYVLAGPDAATVTYRIDGGRRRQVNLFHRFSKNLHYPRTVMFAEGLEPGRHTLRLEIADSTQSEGHAVRILEFAVNALPP